MESRRASIAGIISALVLLLAGLLLSRTAFASSSGPDWQQPPTPTPGRLPTVLAWLAAGGVPPVCDFAPPRVETPTVTAWWNNSGRSLRLCMFGFRENADIVVSAENASGETFSTSAQVGPPVQWSDDEGDYAETTAEVHLLWPGAVPGGEWRVTVDVDGLVYDEMHEIPAAAPHELAELTLTPRNFRNPLRVSFPGYLTCYLSYAFFPGDSMTITGRDYRANTDAELGLYRSPQQGNADYAAERIDYSQIRTDNQGGFATDYRIPADTPPGMYWFVALTDPASELAAGEDGTHCFMVEAPPETHPEASPEFPVTGSGQESSAVVLRNANLRAGPGTNFSRIDTARAGTEIKVVGANPAGDWYQLDTGAWIAAYLVRLQDGAPPSSGGQGAMTSPPVSADPEWVTISAGPFLMGSNEQDIWAAVDVCNGWEGSCEFGWFDGELPRRTVTLPAYAITRYEITTGQYQDCVDAGACNAVGTSSGPRPGERAYPVAGVSWYDADSYCRWIGARLPTEEEWEKAARGSNGRIYPWGSRLDTSLANLHSGAPAPVGSFTAGASPYGVQDMAGNVFEWTSSSVNGRYVLRGGSWNSYPFRGRTADRGTKLAPDSASYDIGFRCAR